MEVVNRLEYKHLDSLVRVVGWVVGWVVQLDYSISSGPFLRFTMTLVFLSEMFDHSVCETRAPSLKIFEISQLKRGFSPNSPIVISCNTFPQLLSSHS